MIESGSSGKYLRYAIGEIALVVIGLLIALQINNRNEERHYEKEELSIIKFKSDLDDDSRIFLQQVGMRTKMVQKNYEGVKGEE